MSPPGCSGQYECFAGNYSIMLASEYALLTRCGLGAATCRSSPTLVCVRAGVVRHGLDNSDTRAPCMGNDGRGKENDVVDSSDT
jgi:hypothetical protein